MKGNTKISEIFLRSIITQTAWLVSSKLLTNVLEAKLPENSLRPRWLVSVPLLQEVSRSLIAIVLALLHSAKPSLPKKYRSSYPQVAIPALSEGTYTGCQGRLAVSIYSFVSSTRGLRGVSCWTFWGYKLVCDPCQEGHHHAERHSTLSTNQKWTWTCVIEVTQRVSECKHYQEKNPDKSLGTGRIYYYRKDWKYDQMMWTFALWKLWILTEI